MQAKASSCSAGATRSPASLTTASKLSAGLLASLMPKSTTQFESRPSCSRRRAASISESRSRRRPRPRCRLPSRFAWPDPVEVEVLAPVAEGRTNRQIGQALFLTLRPPASTSRDPDQAGATGRGEAAATAPPRDRPHHPHPRRSAWPARPAAQLRPGVLWAPQRGRAVVNQLKQWRGIATRFDKRAANYRAGVVIVSLLLWLA